MKKAFDFFLYSNLFISCCAVLMCLETFILLGIKISLNSAFPLIPLIFLSTLFVYNLDLFHLNDGGSQVGGSEREAWRIKNIKRIRIFNVMLAIAIGFLALFSSSKSFWFFVHLAIISIAYYLSFNIGSANFASLRSIPFLKAFIIAYVWTSSTVLLPAFKNEIDLENKDVLMVFTERYLFLFALAIAFDIRDIYYDSKKIKTIPGVFGPVGTKYISFGLLILNIAFTINHYNEFAILIPLILSVILTAVFIYRTHYYSSEYYFLGLIDGSMAIQFFALFISISISSILN